MKRMCSLSSQAIIYALSLGLAAAMHRPHTVSTVVQLHRLRLELTTEPVTVLADLQAAIDTQLLACKQTCLRNQVLAGSADKVYGQLFDNVM